jgi:dolichyl-phosphate-mannose--protein O-mannosyl transferase
VSLAALVLALGLIIAVAFFGLKVQNKNLFNLILLFIFLYGFYMFSALRTERVLYLYHYLIPSIFLFIAGFLVFLYRFETILREDDYWRKRLYFLVALVAAAIFISFVFFAPFTYYLPLSSQEFQMRNWFSFWGLKDVSG